MHADPATAKVDVNQQTLRRTKAPRPYRAASALDAMVMTLLTESNRPLTAYDIARRSSGKGSRITPMQVYRVLDRLDAGGKVQRIELLSAWLLRQGSPKGFLICRTCRLVQAFPIGKLQAAVQHLCRATGFSPSRHIFETWGLCAECDNQVPMARSVVAGKEQRMPIKMKSLLAAMMTAGTMIVSVPVDAAEQRPGLLYDGAGKDLGTITVTEAPKGVLLRIEARGLPPGWHGVHFHEKADCSDAAFKAAGGHVHSEKPVVHGFLVERANDAGDLPNIHVHADGSVTVELYSTLVSMSGADGHPALKDADGSALVIHANPDDYTTQPIGGAGDRIACAAMP